MNAFHRTAGFIRARVPLVKIVASALTIGSGGSAGREGPIALAAAGLGSIYGRWLKRPEEEMRLLVLMGAAAGLAAIFRSPVGTAVFAIEVLYSEMDFEGGALFYTMLSSVVAYAVNGLFVSLHPLFDLPANLPVPGVTEYGWYILLGGLSGLLATLMPLALYSVRDGFRRLRVPNHLKPALGGLGVGVIALALPQVLAGGYGWIQAAIDGRLATGLLLVLAVAKVVSLSLTIGSGGSGGVFGPSLFAGAMLGAALAQLFHQPPASFAVLGMAAVFSGAGRVPIATLLMVMEMTGDYQMFVPAALAVLISYFVEASLSGRYRSLYEGQVLTRRHSPAHHLEQIRVAIELLRRGIPIRSRFDPLDVGSLLSAGVPLKMPDGRALRMGRLRPESRCQGQPATCLGGPDGDGEILFVLRGAETLKAGQETVLRGGDRIAVMASDAVWGRMQEDLDEEPRSPA